MITACVGEFEDERAFVRAARRLRELRYTRIEAYTPYAIPELDEALAIRRTRLGWLVLAAGLAGVAIAWWIQRWCNAVDYPVLVGGRPFDSLPTDVPIMFETGVLFAGTTAFVAMLLASRMPRLWLPILDVPGYERTSADRYWLVVDARDPAWSEDLPRRLAELGARELRMIGDAP